MEGIHKVHEGQVLKSLHSEHVDDFDQVNDARWLLRNYFQLEYREHGEKNRVVYRVLEGLSCDAAGGLVWGVCQWYKLTWENKRESTVYACVMSIEKVKHVIVNSTLSFFLKRA